MVATGAQGLEMKKYAFTPEKREEIIDELESYLTDEFVREVQTQPRAWIYLCEAVRVYPSDIVELQNSAHNAAKTEE